MPLYFFNVHDGAWEVDPEGMELAGLESARHEAVRFMSELMRDRPAAFLNGHAWRLEVTDGGGSALLVLSLAVADGGTDEQLPH